MDFAFSVLFLKFHLIHSQQVEDFERSNVTLLFFFLIWSLVGFDFFFFFPTTFLVSSCSLVFHSWTGSQVIKRDLQSYLAMKILSAELITIKGQSIMNI